MLFPPHQLDAVLFDLDGTLVETAPDLHAVLADITQDLGVPAPPLHELRAMIGDGARALIVRALDSVGHPHDPALVEQLFTRFIERYTAMPCRHSFAYEGVVQVLQALRAQGVPLGICTNKPHVPTLALLAALDMTEYFQAVVGGDSLPVRKPDPGHVLATLGALGAKADGSIFVGDSVNDVKAARDAGLGVILVSFGYTDSAARNLGADLVIDHFAELPAALEKLARAR